MVSLCTFAVAGQRFGIDTTRVQEVVRVTAIAPVPRAPADVRGLLNLRGMIVLAVDTARRLGLPTDPRTTTTGDAGHGAQAEDGGYAGSVGQPADLGMVAVVLPAPEGPVALLVDDVHEILEVDPALFEPTPEQRDIVAAGLIAGAYRTDGQLTLLVDVDAVLAVGTPEPDGS